MLRVDRRVLALQRGQVFPNRAPRPLRVRPIDLGALDPLETAGVGLDHRGIDSKALAADKTRRHAAQDDLLKDFAQEIALARSHLKLHIIVQSLAVVASAQQPRLTVHASIHGDWNNRVTEEPTNAVNG